jgi:putative lysine transport system substrate-binding protein
MKKVISFITTAFMIAALLVSAAACTTPTPVATTAPASTAATEAAAADAGEFKVGMECAYAPFNWTQPTDANGAVAIQGTNEYASGYDVEIAKLIAKGLGKKLVIVKTIWDGLTPAVQSKTIDAIIAGMSPKAERKLTLDFTNYYYQSSLVIVVKKGGKYENATSLADFSGAQITAQIDTLHYDVISQIPGVVKLNASKDFPTMRVALESGSIDGYISEKPEGVSAQVANSNFKMIEFPEGKGFNVTIDDISISVGLNKGSDLTEKINAILAGITDEQRNQLMENAIKNQPSND